MAKLTTPVAFIIFNRPDLTQIVFNAIRQAQPKQLFVIADGGRFPEEHQKCQQARDIIQQVDWDCQVLTNYVDTNLGCRKRISSGINWVFEHVEEAIFLEDDCLPHPSFFKYCQGLLDYYREDKRIWCISGNNFQDGQWRGNGSYYFSNYNHCWGWASWWRAWQYYDHDLSNWQTVRDGQYLKSILDSELEIKYWCDIFERLDTLGQPNSWAYPWTFTCWQNSGLTVLPNVNLVSNIGCRSDGTHITWDSKFANIPVQDIGEIYHPSFLVRDRIADEYTFDHVFDGIAMKELALKNKTFRGKLTKKLRVLKSKLKSLIKYIKQ
ncbi:glycosyltransferase family 2 protein [Pseudanabaena galeata UHCC 0370]|uniref:Glycosyltransferase family 2 protein n=1 Tax=Pseudanabaena galeata UHCC 0370 TaxID=3110310 RepID=A0ABU5TJ99_9CYAN|nr:glycosyltransferase family 2 protein [Pseudanabaena galeata]MEA5478334.1 glycosyltransferase family 2 protein [Pseudanabaena galeata UHCC 0370]